MLSASVTTCSCRVFISSFAGVSKEFSINTTLASATSQTCELLPTVILTLSDAFPSSLCLSKENDELVTCSNCVHFSKINKLYLHCRA